MPSISTEIPAMKIYPNLDEFNRHLPETVRLLHTANGSLVYVIGTAHFSRRSQDDVSLVMQNVRPDKLVLELCPLRLHILYFDEARLLREAAELSAAKVRQIYGEHGLVGGMFYLKFLAINASVTRQLGIAPGGECRRGLAEAQRLPDCQVLLGDRSIDVTMQRAMRAMTLLEKLKLSLFAGLGPTNGRITADDVERLKSRTAAGVDGPQPAGSDEPQGAIPGIQNAFVHERDLLLAHSLHYAANDADVEGGQLKAGGRGGQPVRVVGIVGIGHLPGIVQNWAHRLSAPQLAELLRLPPEKWSHRALRAASKWATLGLCGYAIYAAIASKPKSSEPSKPK